VKSRQIAVLTYSLIADMFVDCGETLTVVRFEAFMTTECNEVLKGPLKEL
jgi:hypothetical protein